MRNNFSVYLDPATYAETMAKLSQLSDIEKTAVVSKGLSDGASIILRETKKLMKQKVQNRTNQLFPSVKKTTKRKKATSYVGFKKGPDKIKHGGAYAHMLDKGTADRWTTKGYYRGKITPRYFHTESVENKSDKALKTLRESIEISINRILNRK